MVGFILMSIFFYFYLSGLVYVFGTRIYNLLIIKIFYI